MLSAHDALPLMQVLAAYYLLLPVRDEAAVALGAVVAAYLQLITMSFSSL